MRKSFRQAVNEMCKQCIYDSKGGDGNWRQQTEACPSTDCPLWELRPVSKPHKDRVDSESG